MLLAGAKTPLQCFHWLKKYTFTKTGSLKKKTVQALLTCYSSRGAVVSVVSAVRFTF